MPFIEPHEKVTVSSTETDLVSDLQLLAVKSEHVPLPLAEGMCLSGWLESVRGHHLLDHRSTESLPSAADVVIIGSGLTGTLSALELLKGPDPPKRVLLLEAREFCSGATGRNAGHCRPDVFAGFAKYRKIFGPEQAVKILNNERRTWEGVVKYVEENKVECEFWKGRSLYVAMTSEVADAAAKNYEDLVAAGGDISGIERITDHVEAGRISRVRGAQAVYSSDASTLHPWMLTAHVAEKALDLGLNLQTWTPVTAVVEDGDGWRIETPRGDVRTPTVIHATNAYAGALLPETRGAIIPRPQLCDRVIPPIAFTGEKALQNSMAVVFPNGSYSVNPRQGGDGLILFGGANPHLSKLLEYVKAEEKRGTDDSLVNFAPVTEAVKNLVNNGLAWSLVDDKPNFDTQWSGITARSNDMVPFIGAVPGKRGQWMCAGHNGHGMARIFTAAPGLITLIKGGSWAETELPECFQVTAERLQRLRGH